MTGKQGQDKTVGAAVLLQTLLLLPIAMLFGWTLEVLWGWFAVPLGVSAIGLWEGAGLRLLVALVTYDGRPTQDERPALEQLAYGVFSGLLACGMALGLGAIFHALGS